MHKCDIKQQFLTSRAARHLSRVCRGPFRRLRFAITETHSTYLQTFIGTLQCLPLSYPDAPGEVWKSFFCNSVCSHLRGNAGLVLFFCSSWWPIKMECKNVHPNQSDLIQGPRPFFSPSPSLDHIGHLVHLPAGFSSCLPPKPATGSNAQNWTFYFPRHLFATMAERMYSPSPFYDWSVAFFLFPEGTFLEG